MLEMLLAETNNVVYDGTWVEIGTPFGSSGVTRAPMVNYGNYLYHFGGYTQAGVRSKALWRYDLTAKTWSQMADAPIGRSGAGMAAVNGKLYVFGGLAADTNAFAGTVYCYDISTNTWSSKSTYPSTNILNVGCLAINNKIYLMGGFNGSAGAASTVNYVYDPSTDTFTKLADRPVGYANGTIFSPDGLKIVTAMGIDASGAGTTVSKTYTISSNTWADSTPANGPAALLYCMGTQLGGYGYGFGGSIGTTVYNTMYKYNGVKWKAAVVAKSPIPLGRRDHAICAANGSIFVVGGSAGTDANTYMGNAWMYTPNPKVA